MMIGTLVYKLQFCFQKQLEGVPFMPIDLVDVGSKEGH
jgi:hypothetical protein